MHRTRLASHERISARADSSRGLGTTARMRALALALSPLALLACGAPVADAEAATSAQELDAAPVGTYRLIGPLDFSRPDMVYITLTLKADGTYTAERGEERCTDVGASWYKKKYTDAHRSCTQPEIGTFEALGPGLGYALHGPPPPAWAARVELPEVSEYPGGYPLPAGRLSLHMPNLGSFQMRLVSTAPPPGGTLPVGAVHAVGALSTGQWDGVTTTWTVTGSCDYRFDFAYAYDDDGNPHYQVRYGLPQGGGGLMVLEERNGAYGGADGDPDNTGNNTQFRRSLFIEKDAKKPGRFTFTFNDFRTASMELNPGPNVVEQAGGIGSGTIRSKCEGTF